MSILLSTRNNGIGFKKATNVQISMQRLSLPYHKKFFNYKTKKALRLKLSNIALDKFQISIKEEFKEISKRNIRKCRKQLKKTSASVSTTRQREKRSSSISLNQTTRDSAEMKLMKRFALVMKPNAQRLHSLKQARNIIKKIVKLILPLN